MTSREELAHVLKVRFKLPPDRPSDAELDLIIRDVEARAKSLDRPLSEAEWKQITYGHVRFVDKYIYKGLNFQDLNALLATIRSQAQGTKK
jgi:hypothetical protein